MSETRRLSAEVIGEIALMQSVVAQLSDPVSILSLVARGFSDLPGVASVSYHRQETSNPPEAVVGHTYPVRFHGTWFAWFCFELNEADAFEPYEPFVQNFCVVLAVMFEAQRQRQAKEALLEGLERMVEERTRDLEEEIGERQAAEEELRRNEESLRTTLDSIGDAVISTDVQGRVLRMNPVAESLTGWPIDEARGRPLAEAFRIVSSLTREPCRSPVDAVLAGGRTVALANHTMLVSRDGTEFQIADSGAPIRADDGRVVGVVLVFRDVTKEYALEEQLRQSQKMEAVGQLAGGVAHDFNNMLGGILGAAELLADHLPADDALAREYHGLIVNTTRKAGLLANKLLAFARKQPQDRAVLDVHERLQDVVALLRRSVDPRISVDYLPEAPLSQVDGDADQLQNLFLNLGLNAAQAMPDGGQLTITTGVRQLDEPADRGGGRVLEAGRYLEIEFRDQGCGIPPENLNRIFEPFFSTKEIGKGTGLGLSTVLGAVQQHGGEVDVESVVGAGAVFRILLPLLDRPRDRVQAVDRQAVRGKGHVLVVDDEEMIRVLAARILESLGYDVSVAENGQRAVELVQRMDSAPDLVLLDMKMPTMNGPDCYARLRELEPSIRVIIATGFAQDEEVERMLDAGVQGFIGKPYGRVELSRLIAKVLG